MFGGTLSTARRRTRQSVAGCRLAGRSGRFRKGLLSDTIQPAQRKRSRTLPVPKRHDNDNLASTHPAASRLARSRPVAVQSVNRKGGTYYLLVGKTKTGKPNVVESTGTYSTMLRFTLVDAGRRLFDAERWCFRGSIDDWIEPGGPKPLDALLKTYVPHLGQESFFELM
jgi:hypothetical protein